MKKKNVLTLCTYRYKCRNLYRGVKQIGLVMIVKKKINYGIRVLSVKRKTDLYRISLKWMKVLC